MRRICRRWTPEEDQYVRDFTGKLPTFAIARKINRTIQAVKDRRLRIGVVEYRQHIYTKADMEIIARPDLSLAQKAEKIGVTYYALANLLLRRKKEDPKWPTI
jgi:hypothetical protein